MKNIIIFFREDCPYAKIKSSTLHIAEELSKKGWTVGWIWGPLPLTVWWKAKGLFHENNIGLKSLVNNGKWINERFFEYCPLTFNPPTKITPKSWLYKMLHNTVPNLKRVLFNNNLSSPNVVVIASTLFASAVTLFNNTNTKIVYHCHSDLLWKSTKKNRLLIEAQDYIIRNSKYVVVVNEYIKERLIESKICNANQVVMIKHGSSPIFCDINHNQRRNDIVLVGIPQTTNIRQLYELVKNCKNSNFKIIGPFNNSIRKLFNKFSNIEFLGSLSYDETIKVLKHSKIGLVCYNMKEFTGSMKICDYLSAGLPVIIFGSNYISNEKISPIFKTNTINDFQAKLSHCFENWNDLSQIAIKYSKNKSWNCKADEFIDFVMKNEK